MVESVNIFISRLVVEAEPENIFISRLLGEAESVNIFVSQYGVPESDN